MKTIKLLLLCMLISFLFFCGCTKDTGDKPYDIETAKMVSTVSGGLLAPSEVIKVTFVADMIRETQTGQNLKKSVFDFTPSLEGNALWHDRRTLIFKPNNNLPFREKYNGTLDLNALFPEYKDRNLEPLEIKFEVAGREIESFKGELVLKNENDPKYLIYQGEINFTEASNLKIIKDATQIKLGRRNLVITWEVPQNEKQFKFKTNPFERTNNQQSLSVKIEKSDLELSYDFTKTITIPALTDLKVVDIIREESGSQPDLKIEFSDELKSGQDVRGFISFKPEIETQLKVLGKTVLVQAPFDFGQSYILKVKAGLTSRWATKLKTDFSEEIQFEDMLPEMKFSRDGVFLPSSNQKKITFMTVNVREVRLKVIKVFASNLGQFLQMENLDGNTQRRDQFSYNIDRVGIEVANKPLQIGETKNKWLQHEIDLSKLIKDDEKGLYLVEITFRQHDMIYDTSEDNLRYSRNRRRDYYNDPSSRGYLWRHGRIYKPIICSDIGLVYKKGHKQHEIFVTNLITAQPMAGARVRLITYQNQIIEEGLSDSHGSVSFDNINQNVFFVEAEKDGERSVIKPNEMAWNLSTFETGGEQVAGEGVRAFIYADRGVHRPGDKIYLSAIIRNQNNTFPEDHPVTLEVRNPKNQIVFTETKRSGVDGFYSFEFSTKDNDLTGNYSATLIAGSKKFYHTLRIETIVPERLKVKIETEKQSLEYTDKKLNLTLKSTYLFGNPASGLRAELSVALSSINKSFKKYSDYIFSNQTAKYQPTTSYIFKDKLNAEGEAKINWKLPNLKGVPSSIKALIKAEVWEKGGRSSKNQISIDIDPYPYYVGVKRPDLKYWYAQTGIDYQVPVVVLSPEGNEAPGRTVHYKIYRNNYTWWWEYDSREQYRMRFKNARNTELVSEGSIISAATPAMINFNPKDRGQYLIEVQDGNKNGHVAAFFINAYPWGETPAVGKDAGILAIKTDKETYNPGDQAIVSFPVPQKASILFTIEKGDKVIESQWYDTNGEESEKNITVNISDKMLPTVYASVAVFQPYAQTANDRPIRMYGVVPLNVELASTHHDLKINMPDELKPEKEFEVEVQTADRQATQLTIAVVDEGLLSLTRFKTPDAWCAFFKKQGLSVLSYDLFNHVIGANKGDIFRTFSVGGGVSEADQYREGQMDQQKAKRFKAVVMFKGPIMTDSDGKAKVKFNMPNYIGAVRVMVVSATGNRYGKAEKSIPVKSDLMVFPTLPRVIGPKDKIKVPVTVFAMKEKLGEVKVQLKLEGPLQTIGEATKTLSFTKTGEEDVLFEIEAKPAVGVAKIRIEANSSKMSTKYETEISVRSSAPRITETIDQTVEPGKTISLMIPNKGLAGSNKATISIQRRPNLKLTRRILWLIRYPYGCIEQTVSSVFPQLYLMEFLPKSRDAKRDIDKNINAAIKRLRKFQLPSGGFAYWPGSETESDWGTSYAGHFLIEAKKLGYNVPEDMFKNWLRFQKSHASRSDKYLTQKVYRNYTLALAGEASFSGLNLLFENQLNDMNDVQKWLLAAGYKMSGSSNFIDRILNSAGVTVEEYLEFGNTYGSTLRDKAFILEQLVIFERWKEAAKLANEISTVISSQNWYSTQTTAFMLMALGKYFKAVEGDESPLLSGSINLPDGNEIPFDTEDINFQVDIPSGFGKQLQVTLDSKSTVKHAYVNLDWSGLPLEYLGESKDHNLILSVEWLDEDGMKISPNSIKQGQAFWGHFTVDKLPAYRSKIDEVALVQVLPAGWEIDNTRLSGESRPSWARDWRLNREEYLDIRDDRVMWFFDIPAYSKNLDFLVKLNTVTVGEFVLPPALVEAMYNNDYRSTEAGKRIKVTDR